MTLDEPPTRVAGLTDAVSSSWSYGIEPVATFGYTALEDDSSFDDKDVSGVAQVGQAYGEIDLEALLAAEPDLVVTHVYPPEGDSCALTPDMLLYGFADEAQLAAVREIAQVVAIEMAGTADDVVARTLELVESLGVDLDTPELTVMAEAAYPGEGLYIAKAPDDPSLRADPDDGRPRGVAGEQREGHLRLLRKRTDWPGRSCPHRSTSGSST